MGVLLGESAVTILFWRAAFAFKGDGETGLPQVHAAFFAGIGFWAALLVADEIFLTFTMDAIEVGHMVIFGSQILSLLAVRLLPDN